MTTGIKYWFLENFDLFNKMGKKNLMKMCHLLEMVHVKKGEEIRFSRKDKKVVYFLKSGTIKIVSTNDGHTRHLVNMGNIFGELDLFNLTEGANDEQAIVLEDGVVCFIEANQMKDLLEKHASLKNELLKLSGLRIKKLQRQLEDLLYKDSKTRIKEFVINYIEEQGEQTIAGFEAKNLLSHKDIAHLTNTSRQTVNNVLSSLRKEGTLEYDSKKIRMNKIVA